MRSALALTVSVSVTVAGIAGLSACISDVSASPSDPDASDTTDAGPIDDKPETGSVVPDVTPPTILSISPADGTKKLEDDVKIVVTFSEPMAKAATEGAFAIDPSSKTSGPAIATWNEAGTVLTIDPKAAYASGTDVTAVTAVPLAFSIGTAAKDVAGNALTAGAKASVWLYRQITQEAPLHASLFGNTRSGGSTRYSFIAAGDSTDDLEVRGYASFVLDALPAGVEIASAKLVSTLRATGTAFASFGDMRIEHITFDAMGAAAFAAAPLHDLGVLIPAVPAPQVDAQVEKDVTIALSDDYKNRATRNNLSQYRIRFTKDLPKTDGASDLAYISSDVAQTKLAVTYLIE